MVQVGTLRVVRVSLTMAVVPLLTPQVESETDSAMVVILLDSWMVKVT